MDVERMDSEFEKQTAQLLEYAARKDMSLKGTYCLKDLRKVERNKQQFERLPQEMRVKVLFFLGKMHMLEADYNSAEYFLNMADRMSEESGLTDMYAKVNTFRIFFYSERGTPGDKVHAGNCYRELMRKTEAESQKHQVERVCAGYYEALLHKLNTKNDSSIYAFDFVLEQSYDKLLKLRENNKNERIEFCLQHNRVWQAVQEYRKNRPELAFRMLKEIQLGRCFPLIRVWTEIQTAFVQAYRFEDYSSANLTLEVVKDYDVTPNMKMLWYITKILCIIRLYGLNNVMFYKNRLDDIWNKTGELSRAMLLKQYNEIGELIRNS